MRAEVGKVIHQVRVTDASNAALPILFCYRSAEPEHHSGRVFRRHERARIPALRHWKQDLLPAGCPDPTGPNP